MSAMCPEARFRSRLAQRGFALVSAIFLLVALAALGAFMLTFSSVQNTTAALDIQGARAYQSARAGIEWGIFQILQNSAGSFAATCRSSGSTSQALPPAGALDGFAVTVDCAVTSYDEGVRTAAAANPVRIYRITATASSGTVGAATRIERQIQVTVEQ